MSTYPIVDRIPANDCRINGTSIHLKTEVRFVCCICKRWGGMHNTSTYGYSIATTNVILIDDMFYVIPFHNAATKPFMDHYRCLEIFKLTPPL